MSNHMSAKALRTMSIQKENARDRKAAKAAARVEVYESESARKHREYLADCRFYFFICAGWLILLVMILAWVFNVAMSAYVT